jgi:cytochrome c-type biogenesis protein CcmF
VGSSLTLFAWRAPKSSLGSQFNLMSRETLILLGNVFLVVSCGSVLLGTIYPLLIDALSLGKISVGPPYFNSVFVPIMIPVLFLIAMGPLANWKKTDFQAIVKRLWLAAVLGLLAGALIPWVMGQWTYMTGLGFLLAFWVFGSIVLQVIKQLKSGKATASFWAMQLGHLGIAVFVIGVVMVSSYQEEKDVRMQAGDVVTVGSYQIKLLGVQSVQGPNYDAVRGDFELSSPAGKVLQPEKRNYFSSAMPMTEAAIDGGLTRDIYISLGEPLDNHAWAVRVYYKPFVDWIWGGCLLMALGGVFAVFDKRYRLKGKAAKIQNKSAQKVSA